MLRCTNCDALLEADHKFCGACGAQVVIQSAQAAQEPAAALARQQFEEKGSSGGRSQGISRNHLMVGLAIAIAIGLLIAISKTVPSLKQEATATPETPSSTSGSVTAQKPNISEDLARAVYGRIVKSTDIKGVVGIVEDSYAASRICRANGQCLPADGTEINTGDTIIAPKEVTLHIEDQDGGYTRHQLTGELIKIGVARLAGDDLAMDVTLKRGSMKGKLRKVSHVIRIGDAFCIASGIDYAAEADRNSGQFRILNGSGHCYHKLHQIKLDAGNPTYSWQF